MDPASDEELHDGRRTGGRRLHAVSCAGLIEGRALCLAPVALLDPLAWSWPDDGTGDWPLCWICLALTHRSEHQPDGVPLS